MTGLTITGVDKKTNTHCTINDIQIRNPGCERVAMLLHRKPQDVRMQAIDNEKAHFAVKTV